jgi:hypothetical protein
MHSFRVVTGMTGLIFVTTVLLVAQSVSGAPAPFIGVTALPSGAAAASPTADPAAATP